MPTLRAIALALLLAALPSLAAERLLLREVSGAPDPALAAPPPASWLIAADKGDAHRLCRVLPDRLELRTGSAGRLGNVVATAFFAPVGQPVSLAVGERLVLRFDLVVDESSQREEGFRLGLYHSDASRPPRAQAYSHANMAAWTGYAVWLRVGPPEKPDPVGATLRVRRPAHPVVFASEVNSVLAASAMPDAHLAVGSHPDNHFTLTRQADGLLLEANIGGVPLRGRDPSPVATRFDALSFFLSGTAFQGGGVTVRKLTVSHLPAEAPAP